jgi:acylphosphatase
MIQCRRFIVSGKVQGVYFRAYTQQQAKKWHLTGHAINLPNGNVEVVACGDINALDKLQAWLKKGSPKASVDNVSVEMIDFQKHEAFTTG